MGLYITAYDSGTAERASKPNSVSTIERRLSSLSWNYSQRGLILDRKDRHIATVMAGIRNRHARPPMQKEAVLAEDIIAMIETLDRGTLRGLRDRAMLLIGYAGGLRRSEIVGLDLKADQTEDGRGSSDATCPVPLLRRGSGSPGSPMVPLPPCHRTRQVFRAGTLERQGRGVIPPFLTGPISRI